MKKQFYAPYVLLALAVVGIAVAFYDAYQLYNGQALWCPPPINGCNEVANSPYAHIYNLPVGYFGVVYYLYMFGLAALLAFDQIVDESLHDSSILGGAFDQAKRMLIAFSIDSERSHQNQVIVDVQAIDLDDQQVQLRQVRGHPLGHPLHS